MKRGRVFQIITWLIDSVLLVIFSLIGYFYFISDYKYVPSKKKFINRVAYIDPKKSLESKGFETCETYIYDYYNPERATYSKGKNGLRKFILSNYKNKNYKDSGYLNIRFVINCHGETGRYVIHENDLNLEPKSLNKNLVDQIFKLTLQLKKWNPNVIHGRKRDSYMYISFRIENGEITQIIP